MGVVYSPTRKRIRTHTEQKNGEVERVVFSRKAQHGSTNSLTIACYRNGKNKRVGIG